MARRDRFGLPLLGDGKLHELFPHLVAVPHGHSRDTGQWFEVEDRALDKKDIVMGTDPTTGNYRNPFMARSIDDHIRSVSELLDSQTRKRKLTD